MHHAIANIRNSTGDELTPEVTRQALIEARYFNCLIFRMSTLPIDVIGISFTTRNSVGAQKDGS
jgi:hypothetical protein